MPQTPCGSASDATTTAQPTDFQQDGCIVGIGYSRIKPSGKAGKPGTIRLLHAQQKFVSHVATGTQSAAQSQIKSFAIETHRGPGIVCTHPKIGTPNEIDPQRIISRHFTCSSKSADATRACVPERISLSVTVPAANSSLPTMAT